MKLTMNAYLKGMKKINREIEVNDSMTLKDFCEHVIISMNGNCKHLYQLLRNEEDTYLGPGCEIIDDEFEEMMDDIKLYELDLDRGEYFLLNYDFMADWDFIIDILKVEEGSFEKDFRVINGSGAGILEDFGVYGLKVLFDRAQTSPSLLFKHELEYVNKEFNLNKINDEIDNFIAHRLELVKPKNYILNVGLNGFNTEIKRKIVVDSNVNLYTFCKLVVLSMNGDLSHLFGLKKGKEFLDNDEIRDKDLTYLELKEKQRFKVIYDFGDNWIFDITVSKITEDYGRKRFEVLSGKGYGIIDDCGGVWGLDQVYNGNSELSDKYDINDFDLEDINRTIDMLFKK